MAQEFLTLDELEANTRRLFGEAGSRIKLTPLGESWARRPIEMITIGAGDRDALIVGIPHPNEPVGAVTIERLIALMLGPDGEQQRRGYRWHFIKAIDPEGLRLNQEWLRKPRTFANYFSSFFRPALDRQPDMTFPVECAGYRFDRSTPENRAWQKAFDLTRPKLHASLHNCEFGGAFNCVSRVIPELTPLLDQNLVRHGLTARTSLDQVGLPLEWVGASVARYPSVPEIVAKELEANPSATTVWPCGEMSPGYAEARFGTFTLVPEVPMWDDPRLRDGSPSQYTVNDQLIEQRKTFVGLAEFFVCHLDRLASMVATRDGEEILASAQDTAQWVLRSNEYFARQEGGAGTSRVLSLREYLQKAVVYALVAARGYATVGRIAATVVEAERDVGGYAAAVQAEAAEAVRSIAFGLERAGRIDPVPVETLSGIQLDAVLACADVLARA